MNAIAITDLPLLLQDIQSRLSRLEHAPDQAVCESSKAQDVYSVAEAAVFLHVSKSTIYQLVSAGNIPFKKRGRRLYFFRTEILQWLSESERFTTPQLAKNVDSFLSSVKKRRK